MSCTHTLTNSMMGLNPGLIIPFLSQPCTELFFHEISPSQSKLYEVTKSSRFDYLNRAYLSKGLYDRAITSVTWQSVEKI